MSKCPANNYSSNVELSSLYNTSDDEAGKNQKSTKKKRSDACKKMSYNYVAEDSKEEETNPYLISCAEKLQ